MPQITITVDCDSVEAAREVLDKLNNRAETAPASTPPATPTPTVPKSAPVDTSNLVDSEGFPFDENLHTAPDNFKADGTWRAKRGKSEEEKIARATWKAAGGDVVAPGTPTVTPPVTTPTVTPMTASVTMPGIPSVKSEPEALPEIGFDEVIARVTDLMNQGRVTNDQLMGLYTKTSGTTPDQCMNVYQSQEPARRALWDELEAFL